MILPEHPLKSERYISDLHFYKEGTFNHRLLNANKEDKTILVTTQDYFPKYLRPYFHQLKVEVRDTETDKIVDRAIDKLKVDVKYDEESNCLLTIRDLVVMPNTEVTISFGVRKILIPFEEYPNDPNRGFNIPHMPIYYTIQGESQIYESVSQSLLLKNIEPDFSMPFNVNAVTNALIGFLFINTYNLLVKPKRFIEHKIFNA